MAYFMRARVDDNQPGMMAELQIEEEEVQEIMLALKEQLEPQLGVSLGVCSPRHYDGLKNIFTFAGELLDEPGKFVDVPIDGEIIGHMVVLRRIDLLKAMATAEKIMARRVR